MDDPNGLVERTKRQLTIEDDRLDLPKKHKAFNSPPTLPLKVFVFGSGESGELGLGVNTLGENLPNLAPRPRINPFLNSDDDAVVQISVGGMHCAALMESGEVLTWGVNDSKALGRDTEWANAGDEDVDLNPLESTPMPVEGLEEVGPIAQVVVSDNATFVLNTTGEVFGWRSFFGDNGAFGFVAASGTKFITTPIRIPSLSNVKALATGVNHLLALTHDGAVWSCGSGHQAELGRRILPRRPYAALEPRVVLPAKHQIDRVFAGYNHNFAIDRRGKVYSWGLNNFGQTGHGVDETILHVVSPAIVKNLEGRQISEIAAGFHHTLALTEDGTLLTWGRCDDGQLGVPLDGVQAMLDSRGNPRAVPVPQEIKGIKASAVAAGIDNCLAVTSRGDVYGWGFSENYRTGLGTELTVANPTKLRPKEFAGRKIRFAGCGGQFSVVAGRAE